MTPAQALDKLLPRWRKNLPSKYSPESIESFIARNRDALEAVVARMMVIHRVKRGVPPARHPEFEIYGELAARQRARETEPDEAFVRRVIAKLTMKDQPITENVRFTRVYQRSQSGWLMVSGQGTRLAPTPS